MVNFTQVRILINFLTNSLIKLVFFFDLIETLIEHRPHGNAREVPILPRTESTSEFMPVDDKEVEYFFASDASAVIEHTNRVIYLEVRYKLFFHNYLK